MPSLQAYCIMLPRRLLLPRLLLLFLLRPSADAQPAQMPETNYPTDRSECPSDDNGCTVGYAWMAAEFPIRPGSDEWENGILNPGGFEDALNIYGLSSGYTGKPVAEAVAEGDITYLLPEGYEIDFTGGLVIEQATYVQPPSYVGGTGDTFFAGSTARVVVNATHFTPQDISIRPGATVSWELETYETISVRSDDNGTSFASGPINRNWEPTFQLTFNEEGVYPYYNAEELFRSEGYQGRITVTDYNCSWYTSCTTCLMYDECFWCPGNGTCWERNLTNNLPLDTGPVVAVEPQEEYQMARWTYGYNTRTALFQFDWYPWPPYRRNPKPVPRNLIGTYFDTIASDRCYAFMRTRDAAQCEDAIVTEPRNRLHGIETPGRPILDDFFMCYAHVTQTWARPDLEKPTSFEGWFDKNGTTVPTLAAPEDEGRDWDQACCELCSSCDAPLLAACNVTCSQADALMSLPDALSSNVTCPWTDAQMLRIGGACGTSRCAAQARANSTRCEQMLGVVGARLDAMGPVLNTSLADAVAAAAAMTSALSQAEQTATSGRGRQRLLSSSLGEEGGDPHAMLETGFKPLGEAVGINRMPQFAQRPTYNDTGGDRRELQFSWSGPEVLTAWDLVPTRQKQLMGKVTGNTDLWATLAAALESRYGPRCNVTHGCDRGGNPPKGVCYNISGLPIYEYDQNGTCVCHSWYTGGDCGEAIINDDVCVGFPTLADCRRVRQMLFECGNVGSATDSFADFLPEECARTNLTVVECGEAGFMQGRRDRNGINNLVGRPDAGYASIACSKCNSRGIMRSETYAKLCDRATILNACQRHEDATAQRLCNYCGGETQGSVMPQRGEDRTDSYFRGTRMGSVEKRIRGIVPPNMDIIGQTAYGGLRYCKKPSTFTSEAHYYSDADIMQVGQTCRYGEVPVFEKWDWRKQSDRPETLFWDNSMNNYPNYNPQPRTIRDPLGVSCADPDNPATCPPAEYCIDESLCTTNTPDWMDVRELFRYWGIETMRQFSDQALCTAGEPGCHPVGTTRPSCTHFFQNAFEEAQVRQAAALYNAAREVGPDGELLTNADGELLQPEQVIVPCTFELHQLNLRPSTAATLGQWSYLSQAYKDRYTYVTWSPEGANTAYPPPNPPPNPPQVFQSLG